MIQPCSRKLFVFQSTFPRGERRAQEAQKNRDWQVSIHVPTRGTTRAWHSDGRASSWSFNPRSHEGNDAALNSIVSTLSAISFNPRSHEGNDAGLPWLQDLLLHGFNPRSHEGNDAGTIRTWSCAAGSFQSTFPRGERRNLRRLFVWQCQVSIHVPTRGTTRGMEKC